MAQDALFENPDGEGYGLRAQIDLLSGLNTSIIVPLLMEDWALHPAKQLSPVFETDGTSYVLVT